MEILKKFSNNALNWQLVALICLSILNSLRSDFAPHWWEIITIISFSAIIQIFFLRLVGLKGYDVRSAVISGFSLSFLLKASFFPYLLLAVIVVNGSKFIFRLNDKHIFNPVNFAIVFMLLLFPDYVWVSPGQWGNTVWVGALAFCLAIAVLSKAHQLDTAAGFLLAWTIIVFGRALWLGDPMDIPMQQISNGALLIFAFFMVTDPKTSPQTWWGRIIYVIATASIAAIFQFEFYIREALFYSLTITCLGYAVLLKIRTEMKKEKLCIQG